jgi:tetratricopeptide (TPR) repeat protein
VELLIFCEQNVKYLNNTGRFFPKIIEKTTMNLLSRLKYESLLIKGQKLYKSEKYPEALLIFEQAEALGVKAPDLLLFKALVLKELDQEAEAEELLKQAQALAPGSPSILLFCGLLYYDQGRLDEAESSWRKGLELEPANLLLRNLLALLSFKLKNDQAGLKKLMKGGLYPNPEFLSRLLLELERNHV